MSDSTHVRFGADMPVVLTALVDFDRFHALFPGEMGSVEQVLGEKVCMNKAAEMLKMLKLKAYKSSHNQFLNRILNCEVELQNQVLI